MTFMKLSMLLHIGALIVSRYKATPHLSISKFFSFSSTLSHFLSSNLISCFTLPSSYQYMCDKAHTMHSRTRATGQHQTSKLGYHSFSSSFSLFFFFVTLLFDIFF